MKVPLQGFAPDVDPTTPGVFTDCVSFVGSYRGMEGAPSAINTSLPALAADCVGFASFRKLDGTSTLIAGTATKLYSGGTSSWTDRSGAATFNASVTNRWSFTQFGDVTLASNKADTIQGRTSGDFAAVSGSAPKAAYIDTVGQFVFAGNVNDGADKPDGWACSALGDYTNWSASVATQSANGRLTDTPGPFTGIKRLSEAIVLYKRKSTYVGTYIGGSIIWTFQLSSSEVGALNNACIASVDYAHYFMGEDDFYMFDGTRPVPFGAPVKVTVFSALDKSKIHLCQSLVDVTHSRIYFFYPDSTTTSYANRCVVYNYRTRKWGKDDRTIQAAGVYVSSGLQYQDLGTYYSTYANFPNAPYGSAFLAASTETPAIIDSTATIKTLTGTPGITSFRLGDYGDNFNYSLLRRVEPRFFKEPQSGAMTNYYKYSAGEDYMPDTTTAMDNRRFDLMRSARWHTADFSFTGAVDLSELQVDIVEQSLE